MGLYPSPFLRRLDTSVQHIVARVSPQYAAEERCGLRDRLPPAVAPNPAAKFLESLPCGPDGKPLAAPAASGTASISASRAHRPDVSGRPGTATRAAGDAH